MSLVDDTFGPGGHLARALPGYEPRAPQLVLAEAIDAAIREGASLLAEAPTGVGKSAAYLVPAIRHAVESGSRVLVATANIVLQEQLVKKDLPMLRDALPVAFDFGLAKGRANFLCVDRLDETVAERALMGPRDDEKGLEAIVEWAANTEEGDLSELSFEPRPALRRLFTVTSDECLGSACPRKEECFPNRARAKLQTVQVIVANYHLLFSDLVVREATDGEVGILPDFDVLIADEAHRAPDIARDFFGSRVSAGGVRWAARLLSGAVGKAGKGGSPEIDAELKERLGRSASRFFDALGEYAKSDAYRARLRADDPVPSSDLIALLDDAATRYEQTAADAPLDPAARKKLRQSAARCSSLASTIGRGMKPGRSDGEVFFVELPQGGGSAALCSKPIDVSETLRRRIFETPSIRSAIATSATLATNAERLDFEFVASELGADKARAIAVPSPFDFAGRCLFVVPEQFDVCLPNEPGFAKECARLFARIAELARGRTLGLFTTRKAMDMAYEEADREVCKRMRINVARPDADRLVEYLVLKQGTAPRSQLVKQFREDVSSVLVGTASLWEGVDVPGEALSCVVLDKLPFPPPDDPVLDALDARDRDAFSRHSLPRALIAFRQGCGRLIRSSSDRGVIVCMDRRLCEKGYGKKFLRALPAGVRVSRSVDEVRSFLDGETAVGTSPLCAERRPRRAR